MIHYLKKHCFLLFFFCFLMTNAEAQKNNFVSARGSQFFQDEKPLYYIGTNYWYGSLIAAEKDKKQGIERLRAELDFLSNKGVLNLRILAGAEGQGLVAGVERVGPPLQEPRGIFNDQVLEGLDVLLSEMAKRNMKAVIFLSNNWEWSGGFLQYLRWNNKIPDSVFRRKLGWDETRDIVSGFYDCDECKTDYLQQVIKVVSRTNAITKKRYADDATIMAWEIANEPRPMRPVAVNNYIKWIRDVSTYIKSADPNHLLTIGTEGYIGTENIRVYETIHAIKEVDYLTIHIWPKNWEWFTGKDIAGGMDSILAKTMNYISAHSEVALKLNKPLVIEEFGLPRDNHAFDLNVSTTTYRDKYYQRIFTELEKSKTKNGVIAAANFWSYGGNIKPTHTRWEKGDPYIGDPPMEEQGLNAVFNSDETTWKIIHSFSKNLH